MKTCKKCGETKALSEFNKHRGNKDGLQYTCKACKKAVSAIYYTKTKEVQAERSRRYREANIERVRARSRKYYQENKEIILARQQNEHTKKYMRTYYLAHKDEIDARVRLWHKEHPEESRARSKRWRETHPEQKRISAREFAKNLRGNLGDSYIKQIFNRGKKGNDRLNSIPQELIEVKRLQLLINRKIRDENLH